MLRKEKLTEMLIGGFRARKTNDMVKRGKNNCFQRDKEALVMEILNYHEQKTCQQLTKLQQAIHVRDDELYFHLDRKGHVHAEQEQIVKQSTSPLHAKKQHFNDYIQQSKQSKANNFIKLLAKNQPQSYQIIDNFLKNKENVMTIQENQIKTGKCHMKSINQSTMAISKFYKPQLSPQNRKMRKTQGKHFNAKSKSRDRNQERRQDNQEYQSCIFSLSDNEASNTYSSKNDNTLSNYEQIKKVSINLNLPKEKIKTSLVEIQEFQQLFDCNYQEEKQENQEKGLMEYLKNKISKGKNKPLQKISSQSSSSCSFLQGKERVTEMGISKVNNIVEQAVKNVAFHLQKQKNANEDNHLLAHQSSDQDLSSNFFANLQSQPSTVQKFDDKSHDKSEMLRHLQQLKECSASLFNHKLPQQYLLQELNSSHLSQHFQNVQAESCKKIEIDLQNMMESNKEEGTSREQSNIQPSMNSFKMEVSMDMPEKNKNKGKRIEIHLNISCSRQSQEDNSSKEVINLEQLSNYESDDEQVMQKEVKPKAKIILKTVNNTEKHFIDGLKNDISALKNKISSSFISQQSQLSFIKTPIEKATLHPNQVYNQLKSGFSNLKRRMQQDAGLRHP